MGIASELIDPNWKKKYKTLREFYANEYDPKYFTFNKYELEIDPLETMEEIEAYDAARQQKEQIKCAMSFSYFCHKYVKIAHPKLGLLPFVLYNYQRRCIKEYEQHRFNILSKFRQGGLTTVTVLWCMWRCMFKLDETIMVLSKSDREAIAAGEIVKRGLEELPSWMKPQMNKNNDHQKFFDETGCKLFFYTPQAARGRSITYLVIDEAAFIKDMDKNWKAMYPTISTGGHCICISTVNGVGNWYYDMFIGAQNNDNPFHVIELDYWEHPEYNDPEWVKTTKAQLGEKGWRQEVLRDFLGAGNSYIPNDIICDLENAYKHFDPIKILFPQWNNLDELKDCKNADLAPKGAFQIWRNPVEGREYILGIDCSAGLGGINDNSVIEVIDEVTGEQVAEFYSNLCPPYQFAQVVAMVGQMYNNGQIIIEDNGGYGTSVLDKLIHEFHYENLFEASQGTNKNPKPGIKTTLSNRPKFIELMQTMLLNKGLSLKSKRLFKELKGFIWNEITKRAEASNGFHDDAIFALCLALYARDIKQRSLNLVVDNNTQQYSESFKAQLLEDIKKELFENENDEWLISFNETYKSNNLDPSEYYFNKYGIKRNNDALLREFGW